MKDPAVLKDLDTACEKSNAVKEQLERGRTIAEGFERAFRPDGALNSLWEHLYEALVTFKESKKDLVLSVWEGLTSPEQAIRASLLCCCCLCANIGPLAILAHSYRPLV